MEPLDIEPLDEAKLPLDREIEVARGVRVQRRSFLEFAALGLVAGWLPRPRRTLLRLPGLPRSSSLAGRFDDGAPGSELTYEQFLEQAVPVARELVPGLVKHASRIGEDRYLLALASHAVRLRDVPVPELRDNTLRPDSAARTWIGANEGSGTGGGDGSAEDPFVVLHWRMDPGAEIRQHPHIYGSVVTLGLEGEARIRNFEQVDGRDFGTKEPFRVRQVVDQLLLPGGINLVPLEHGYTHGFVAGPQGARGLDITTRTRARQPTPTLELSDEPLDAERALWEGRWIHR